MSLMTRVSGLIQIGNACKIFTLSLRTYGLALNSVACGTVPQSLGLGVSAAHKAPYRETFSAVKGQIPGPLGNAPARQFASLQPVRIVPLNRVQRQRQGTSRRDERISQGSNTSNSKSGTNSELRQLAAIVIPSGSTGTIELLVSKSESFQVVDGVGGTVGCWDQSVGIVFDPNALNAHGGKMWVTKSPQTFAVFGRKPRTGIYRSNKRLCSTKLARGDCVPRGSGRLAPTDVEAAHGINGRRSCYIQSLARRDRSIQSALQSNGHGRSRP
jgi:hypothetical protein